MGDSEFKVEQAIVIGASGGIGTAFVDQLNDQYPDATIHELSRSQNNFDFTDEEAVKNAADQFDDQSIDLIILATGFLGGEPEKSMRDLSINKMQDVFAVNCFGPAMVMKYFLPKLSRAHKTVFAALSARVGSIGDNQLGGWYSYRASKSALNMIIKTSSIEVARYNKNACVIGLHPGTVDTNLSKPFQSHVAKGKLFTPTYSVQQMLSVIHRINAGDSGAVLAYDGSHIPW